MLTTVGGTVSLPFYLYYGHYGGYLEISDEYETDYIELECGCPRMTVEPVTETVCPTVTNCVQCTVSRYLQGAELVI